MSQFKIATKCVQSGYSPKNGEPRVLPIAQSTTYKYDSSVQMAKLFDLEENGFFYTRLANPTVDAGEKKIADLDPVDRKFESMEAFDEYMTKYHLAMTDLVNEASKPEVHAALYNVNKVLLMKRDRGVSRCSKRLLRPPSKLVIYVTTG